MSRFTESLRSYTNSFLSGMGFNKNVEERSQSSQVTYGDDNYIKSKIQNAANLSRTYDKQHPDQIATVYSCCKILADYLARIPITIVQEQPDGTEVTLFDDYRYDLLYYQPNSYQNRFKFWNSREYVKNLQGNSFVEIKRTAGRPSSLVSIPSHLFKNTKQVNGQLYYIFYKSKEAALTDDKDAIRVINSSNLLHFTNVTSDGIKGISPIKALDQMYNVNWSGWTTLENSYKKGLKSAKALTYSSYTPNKKARDERKNQLEEEYFGAVNSDSLMVLDGGENIIDLQITPKDAEFISTIKFTTVQIASAFRIPAHMLNILESSKFNSVFEMQEAFIKDEFGSTIEMYEQELNFKLLTLEERKAGMKIKFDTDNLLKMSPKTRIEVQDKEIKMGTKSINEIRKANGQSPIPNGDYHMMPSNFMWIEGKSIEPKEEA